MKLLLLFFLILGAGCASSQPPNTQVVRELGRHQLPFRPNERFVLLSVVEGPGEWMIHPLSIVYFLDGRRREFQLIGKGATDGYVTDMGRLLSPENEGAEGPIIDERVIQLASGEELTVDGNTIDRGGIRLRAVTGM